MKICGTVYSCDENIYTQYMYKCMKIYGPVNS